jgi:hypothetical protein
MPASRRLCRCPSSGVQPLAADGVTAKLDPEAKRLRKFAALKSEAILAQACSRSPKRS